MVIFLFKLLIGFLVYFDWGFIEIIKLNSFNKSVLNKDTFVFVYCLERGYLKVGE